MQYFVRLSRTSTSKTKHYSGWQQHGKSRKFTHVHSPLLDCHPVAGSPMLLASNLVDLLEIVKPGLAGPQCLAKVALRR